LLAQNGLFKQTRKTDSQVTSAQWDWIAFKAAYVLQIYAGQSAGRLEI
jgi:hypothetical protein